MVDRARLSIAMLENVISNAERRALRAGEAAATARPADLFTAISAVTGKVELVYDGEREGIGAVAATKIEMTAMPQMVALLNGFGGAGSALVAGAEYVRYMTLGQSPPADVAVTIQLSILIGSVTCRQRV